MANQLTNSIVRGFGFTLGNKAANAITKPSTQSVSFSKKQLELIKTYEDIIKDVTATDAQAEKFFKDGKITEKEYLTLKTQINEQLSEATTELEKVRNASPKGGSFWKWFFILLFGVPFLIGLLKGLF